MRRIFRRISGRHLCQSISTLAATLVVGSAVIAAGSASQHPLVGKRFVPTDVDYDNLVFESSFNEDCMKGVL